MITTVEDGMYYEVTHNGDTGDVYVAAYAAEEIGRDDSRVFEFLTG